MKRIFAAAVLLLVMTQFHPVWAEDEPIINAARQIEAQLDARVGLLVRDTGAGRSWSYNADQRFPMASTFKVLACAALLAREDAGEQLLDREVQIETSDLVTYAPVTEDLVGQSVSLGTLCETTMRVSDNTAANKVLDALGGPETVTRFARTIGDETTRVDRRETELNEGAPGDPRDTTSPAAMAATFQNLVLGDVLSPSSRKRLVDWLSANEVAGPLLRAVIPSDWRIGDRSGAGGHGTRGIVAILWPPDRAPLIAAIYITQTDASMDERNAAIAGIGTALVNTILSAP